MFVEHDAKIDNLHRNCENDSDDIDYLKNRQSRGNLLIKILISEKCNELLELIVSISLKTQIY